MSFQDVKKRQHHIFDNHRYSKPEPVYSHSPSSSVNNNDVDRRQMPSSSRDKSNGAPHQRRSQSQPLRSQHEYSPSFSHVNHPRRKNIGQQRPENSTREKSVRPCLTTACPVTHKNLLFDEESASTHETLSAEFSSDEQSMDLPITERVHPKSQTRFSHLNSAIVNFQVCIRC